MSEQQKQAASEIYQIAAQLSGEALARLTIYGEGLRDGKALQEQQEKG